MFFKRETRQRPMAENRVKKFRPGNCSAAHRGLFLEDIYTATITWPRVGRRRSEPDPSGKRLPVLPTNSGPWDVRDGETSTLWRFRAVTELEKAEKASQGLPSPFHELCHRLLPGIVVFQEALLLGRCFRC